VIRRLLALILVVAVLYLIVRVRSPRESATRPLSPASPVSPGIARNGCGDRTIRGDGVGNLRIGESADSVKARCTVMRDTTQLGLEGMQERRMLVGFGKDTLDAEIVDGKVWRLDVRSSAFQTPDSVGVGTPLRRLLGQNARGLVGEGVLAVVSPDRCGLSFILSGGIPGARVRSWDNEALARLPASTSVKRILVLGCRATTMTGFADKAPVSSIPQPPSQILKTSS
jgi:hypothetical protein